MLWLMTNSLPHVPRARPIRAKPRCPDDSPFVFNVVLNAGGDLIVWSFSDLTRAERKFVATQREMMREDIAARVILNYVHIDCDTPERHGFADDTE